jgi:hypothetical protein
MRSTKPALVFAVLLLLAGQGRTQAAAQESASKPTLIRVSAAVGAPGSQPASGVYLFAAPDVKVGAIELKVHFSNRLLSFVRAEKSGLAEAVEAEVTAEVKPGTTAEESVLEVTIRTPGEGASRQPIFDGPVVHLLFKIAAEAKPGERSTLAVEAVARTLGTPPQEVAPLTVEESRLVVLQPGATSCFFYMH